MCGRFVDRINKSTLVVKRMNPYGTLQGGGTMKLKTAKTLLQQSIKALTDCKDYFTKKPLKDFSRPGKLPFEPMIQSILCMGAGSLSNEMMDFISNTTRFDFLPKHSKWHDPAVFYPLSFRIVRFPISKDTSETIITNLDADRFPPSELKQLYAMR